MIDPDKPEAYEVAKECIKAKDLIKRYKVEIWIGTSKENFQTIRNYVELLKDFSNITIFPGRPDHALCYSKKIASIFRPTLLNFSKRKILVYVKIGKILTNFFKLVYPTSVELADYGYLITGPNSTVGKKVGAKELNESEICYLAKHYMQKSPKVKGIYVEKGSGAPEAISPKIVSELKRIVNKKELIVGGGIRSVEKAKELFYAGADKIVVGTYFEENPRKIGRFIKELYSE